MQKRLSVWACGDEERAEIYRFSVTADTLEKVERMVRGILEERCKVWRCRWVGVVDEDRPEEPFRYCREVVRRGKELEGQGELEL